MSTEIRKVKADEMTDYLKVLPYANGLPHWEPFPAAWHSGAEAWPQPNAPASPAHLAAWADELLRASHFHPQAAFADGGRIETRSSSELAQHDLGTPAELPIDWE